MLGLPENRRVAPHVEPQLLAFLLDHHLLYPISRNEDKYDALAGAMPTYILRPVITVSKPDLCDECSTFFKAFKKEFPGFEVKSECIGDELAPPLQEREWKLLHNNT